MSDKPNDTLCAHRYKNSHVNKHQLKLKPRGMRQELNRLLDEKPVPEGRYADWRAELKEQEAKFPLAFPQRDDVIVPQWAIKVRLGLFVPTAVWVCLHALASRPVWCANV